MAFTPLKNAKKNPKILSGLDKPFQAAREFINPEEKKARLAQESFNAQRDAAMLQSQQQQQSVNKPVVKDVSKDFTNQREVLRDAETGAITGAIINGKTFANVGGKEARGLLENARKKAETPLGAVENSVAEQARQTAAAQEQAIANGGQVTLDQNGQPIINQAMQFDQNGQPIQQGGVQPNVTLGGGNTALSLGLDATSIAAGAGTGATLGSSAGPAGTIIGGIIGGFTALVTKLALDRKKVVKEANAVFSSSKTSNNQLLNFANHQIAPPADIIHTYEQNLANIRLAERQLTKETQSVTGEKLTTARADLVKVREYLSNERFYRAQLYDAIRTPNPLVTYPTEDLSNIEVNQ